MEVVFSNFKRSRWHSQKNHIVLAYSIAAIYTALANWYLECNRLGIGTEYHFYLHFSDDIKEEGKENLKTHQLRLLPNSLTDKI